MRGFGEGFSHSVVSLDGRSEAAELVPPNVDIQMIEAPSKQGPLGGVRGMRHLLRREQPDLLLTYNWGAMDAVLAARSLGLSRHVHHEDGFNADETDGLKARRNVTRRGALARTDLIVPSRTLEQIARRTWHLSKVHLVPNGIDTVPFARNERAGAAFRQKYGVPNEALLVGAVGHLRPVKNFSRLVRAFELIERTGLGRPLHLFIAGEGPARGELEEVLRASALPEGLVHMPGHVTDIKAALSAFDVFALSSDSEQHPLSILEAMAAGCPVVATDVGDVSISLPEQARAEMIALGPGVEAGLAAALMRLLADDERRAELARAGLEHVNRTFSLRVMLAAYRRIWESAMQRGSRSAARTVR